MGMLVMMMMMVVMHMVMMMLMMTMLAPTLTTGQMQRTQCIGGSMKIGPNTGRIPPHRLAVAFVLPSLKCIDDMCL